MEAPYHLKIHEWDEALNQVARHLVHTSLLKILVLMINERGMKGKSVVSAKLEMSPIRFERFYCGCSLFRNSYKSPFVSNYFDPALKLIHHIPQRLCCGGHY
jgi:hypothetical protein